MFMFAALFIACSDPLFGEELRIAEEDFSYAEGDFLRLDMFFLPQDMKFDGMSVETSEGVIQNLALNDLMDDEGYVGLYFPYAPPSGWLAVSYNLHDDVDTVELRVDDCDDYMETDGGEARFELQLRLDRVIRSDGHRTLMEADGTGPYDNVRLDTDCHHKVDVRWSPLTDF